LISLALVSSIFNLPACRVSRISGRNLLGRRWVRAIRIAAGRRVSGIGGWNVPCLSVYRRGFRQDQRRVVLQLECRVLRGHLRFGLAGDLGHGVDVKLGVVGVERAPANVGRVSRRASKPFRRCQRHGRRLWLERWFSTFYHPRPTKRIGITLGPKIVTLFFVSVLCR
jgi:hypothetical protein